MAILTFLLCILNLAMAYYSCKNENYKFAIISMFASGFCFATTAFLLILN